MPFMNWPTMFWRESYKGNSRPFDLLTTIKSADNCQLQKEIFSQEIPNLFENPTF
jgi:hypothetical protein